MQEYTDETFDAEVIASTVPVLVDFAAEWCGPCKMSRPAVEQLADQAVGFKVGTVDIDRSPATAARCLVKSVPTFYVFSGGRAVAKHTGAANAAVLRSLLAQAGV